MKNFKLGIVFIGLIILTNPFYVSCKKENTNLVKVKFNFNHTLTWNLQKGDFENDNRYKEVKANYQLLKDKIILSVLDTTSLNFNTCLKTKSKTRKGDLSIILINSIEKIQFSKIFKGSQYDNFIKCRYPKGLFDRIESERKFFVKKLQQKNNEYFLTK